VKKPRVRRKKVFWTPIKPEQIREDSLWSMVKGRVQMSRLNYDAKEFADLFTESADGDAEARQKEKLRKEPKAKKSVQVIDGKRSMNGGIILLRLRMDYQTIAGMVNKM
jgi:Formin Homology 2 Domain